MGGRISYHFFSKFPGPRWALTIVPQLHLSFFSVPYLGQDTVNQLVPSRELFSQIHIDNSFTPYFGQDKTGIFQNNIYLEYEHAHTDTHQTIKTSHKYIEIDISIDLSSPNSQILATNILIIKHDGDQLLSLKKYIYNSFKLRRNTGDKQNASKSTAIVCLGVSIVYLLGPMKGWCTAGHRWPRGIPRVGCQEHWSDLLSDYQRSQSLWSALCGYL